MKIGLFFGSFNPIHHGHLMVASYIANHSDLQQIWLVVSPHNPHKSQSSLLNEYDRLHLAQLAVENDDQIKVSDIEYQDILNNISQFHFISIFNLIFTYIQLKTCFFTN